MNRKQPGCQRLLERRNIFFCFCKKIHALTTISIQKDICFSNVCANHIKFHELHIIDGYMMRTSNKTCKYPQINDKCLKIWRQTRSTNSLSKQCGRSKNIMRKKSAHIYPCIYIYFFLSLDIWLIVSGTTNCFPNDIILLNMHQTNLQPKPTQ